MDIFFLIIYLIGWVAILGSIVFLWEKYKKSHRVPELIENFLGFVLLVSFGLLGITLMNGYKQKIEDDLRHRQLTFCLETQGVDGEQLTEEQCEFLQDVFNGKYYED